MKDKEREKRDCETGARFCEDKQYRQERTAPDANAEKSRCENYGDAGVGEQGTGDETSGPNLIRNAAQ